MKIAIVTVYGGHNYGSYWQGRTLYDYLITLGHDVYFYDTNSRNIKFFLVTALKSAVKLNIKKSIFYFRLHRYFKNNLKEVKAINSKKDLADFDLMIFGSDEIWNVKRDDMRSYPEFWGLGFEGIKKISYAPSINLATSEDLRKNGFENALNDFFAVSVRDEFSASEIRKIFKGEVCEVLDPTFLFDDSYYKKMPMQPIKDSYIGVSYFDLTDEEYVKMRSLADFLKLKLVRIGAYDKRFDQCIISKNVFCYFLNADYIITNTFHGTAFSINFNKQLIVFNPHKLAKIDNLLRKFDLSDREMTDFSADEIIKFVSGNHIDWTERKTQIDEAREYSRNFLKRTINYLS